MNITFEELRKVKHALPTGSVSKIAKDLNIDEQTVRNYFGAKKYEGGQIVGYYIEPGPNGGVVHLDDDSIFKAARKIIAETQHLGYS
ncbi:MAG: DNA-binding protein [Saprospiraceae bacterium]|jgi:predicted transcriptional regulator|nr:DNA-binding protein [Saprospiraceae bacterium]